MAQFAETSVDASFLSAYLAAQASSVVAKCGGVVEAQTAETLGEVRSAVGSVFSSGQGRQIVGAIRSKLYRDSATAEAGIVYSKLGRRENGEFVDYLLPQVEGATIRPTNARMLLIPIKGVTRRTDKARRDIGQVGIDPKLAIIWRQNHKFAWFVRKTSRNRFTLIAILVRLARVKAKLAIDPIAQRAGTGTAEKLVAALASDD